MKDIFFILLIGIVLMSPTSGMGYQKTGLVDGKLLPCDKIPKCVSSQAFEPDQVVMPLSFGGVSWPKAKERLLESLKEVKDCRILKEESDYIHAECTSTVFRFTHDVEFLADHVFKIINVRCAFRSDKRDYGTNRRLVEKIRTVMDAQQSP